MDKLQRQLIDTYFVKRNKMVEKHPENREKYETEYILAHPEIFDVDNMKFSNYKWLDQSIRNPEELKKYTTNPREMRKNLLYTADQALKYFPELIEFVDLYEISKYTLIEILVNNPEIITNVPKVKLAELRTYEIERIITKHPEVAKYFDLYILDKWDIIKIIEKVPQVIESNPEILKKLENLEFDDYDLIDVLSKNIKILKFLPHIKERKDYKEIITRAIAKKPQIFVQLMRDPELKKLFSIDDLDPRWVTYIIEKWPGFLKQYPSSKIDAYYLLAMAEKNPKTLKYIDFESLDEYTSKKFAIKFPSLANRLNFGMMFAFDIKEMLTKQPQLIKVLLDKRFNNEGYDMFLGLQENDIRKLVETHPSLEPYLMPYITEKDKKWKEYAKRRDEIIAAKKASGAQNESLWSKLINNG